MSFIQAIEGVKSVKSELDALVKRKKSIFRRILRKIDSSIDQNIDDEISSVSIELDSLINNVKQNFHKVDDVERDCLEVKNSGIYLCQEHEDALLSQLSEIEAALMYLAKERLFEKEFLIDKQRAIQNNLLNIENYNRNLIERLKKKYNPLFEINRKDVSKYNLDEEQKEAVLKDDKCNLVVAGAGTGKTEVLITRIRYLCERESHRIQPTRILALAYTNNAVDEIKIRLHNYGIDNVNVETFHRLANAVLHRANKRLRVLGENKPEDFVKEIIKQKSVKDERFQRAFLEFVKCYRDSSSDIRFDKVEEKYDERRHSPYVSINGWHVKSIAEKDIVDFFLTHKLNGERIKIKYEPIVQLSSDKLGHDFEPDIYLVDYNLFLEHWALDANGKVPKAIKETTLEWSREELERYRRNMRFKQNWFRENNKLLIETYSNEFYPDNSEIFLNNLEERITTALKKKFGRNFKFKLMTYREIIQSIWGNQDPIPNNVYQFIRNAKVYALTPIDIKKRLITESWSSRQKAFGKLALIVYEAYEEMLDELKRNDFEDLINKAVTELRSSPSLFKDCYDHILIDEYQDISQQRHDLIIELLKQNSNCKLFCVGDDWQSIMGFAGSDLDYFVDFEKYMDIKPATTWIQTNYRSTKTIVEAGNDIIKNNIKQISKNPISNNRKEKKIQIVLIQCATEEQYHQLMIDDCIARIKNALNKDYGQNDILILSRYNHTFNHFHRESYQKKLKKNSIQISERGYIKDKIRLVSVHRSKGLEARRVILLDLVEGDYGFPSRIEDPAILEPAKGKKTYGIEEERRLFYVAINRAKEDLIIYTWNKAPSRFLNEITRFVTVEQIFGTVLCQICKSNYHSAKYKMCWDCAQKLKGRRYYRRRQKIGYIV